MKTIKLLPNLLTLGNAALGLLAIAKGIDALAVAQTEPLLFYAKLEFACFLILFAMVFDALDGKVARITGSTSDFGAQLDSFADLLTFGIAPAILAKVLIEHDGPLVGYFGHPRLHFLAAATFSLFAILRLARFNLETDADASSHATFRGLPSPAAAGAVVSTILVYMLPRKELQIVEGEPTPVGTVMNWIAGDFGSVQSWMLPGLALLLVALGFLMVSRVPYAHVFSTLSSSRSQFFTLIWVLFGAGLLYSAPQPVLFVAFNGFALWGVVQWVFEHRRRRTRAADRIHP